MSDRRRLHPDVDQVVLRAMVPLGTMVVLVAAAAAGGSPPGWLQVGLLGLAVVVGVRPESGLGVLLLLGCGYAWALSPRPLAAEVLTAAAGMLLAHVAALVAAQGPARMRVEARQVILWALRCLPLLASAVAVWAGAVAMADLPGSRLVHAAGLVLLAVVATAATWVVAGGGPGGLSTSRGPA